MLLHKIIVRALSLLIVLFWMFNFPWIMVDPVWWVFAPSVLLSAVVVIGFLTLRNFGRLAFLLLWLFLIVVALEGWWEGAKHDGRGPFHSYNLLQLRNYLMEWPLYFLIASLYLFCPSVSRIFKGWPRFYIARE